MPPTSSSTPPEDDLTDSQRAHWLRRQHTAPHALGGPSSPGTTGETATLFRRYVRGEITLTEAIDLARQQQAAPRSSARRHAGPRRES